MDTWDLRKTMSEHYYPKYEFIALVCWNSMVCCPIFHSLLEIPNKLIFKSMTGFCHIYFFLYVLWCYFFCLVFFHCLHSTQDKVRSGRSTCQSENTSLLYNGLVNTHKYTSATSVLDKIIASTSLYKGNITKYPLWGYTSGCLTDKYVCPTLRCLHNLPELSSISVPM